MALKSTQYKREYNEKTYNRISVTIPIGRLQDIQAYAKSKCTSVNALINEALQNLLGMTDQEWKAKPTDSLDIDSQDNSD